MMEKDIPGKENPKELWNGYTNTRQNRFQDRNVTGVKQEHFLMIKGLIQQEGITILNLYAPNRAT